MDTFGPAQSGCADANVSQGCRQAAERVHILDTLLQLASLHRQRDGMHTLSHATLLFTMKSGRTSARRSEAAEAGRGGQDAKHHPNPI